MSEPVLNLNWISAKSAARRLGVSRQRVYQLTREGKISWRKMDGLVLINGTSVEDRVRARGKGKRNAY